MSEPDYTFAVEAPPGESYVPPPSEMITNLHRAVDHPNEWCRIAAYEKRVSASAVASELRSHKRAKTRPAGRWEFKSSAMDDGRTGVYAMYLGPDEPPNEENP